jgi:tetratricopeptide (TPR) repeat protein
VVVWLLTLALTIAAPQAGGSAAGSSDAAQRADAYNQFLLARYLERSGQIEDAVAALERAATLDPEGAEILAELAGLHARQNRISEAMAAAERALRIDPGSSEANRVLGSIHASLAERSARGGDDVDAAAADKAIAHLERAAATRPLPASLALSLGRLQLLRGMFDKAAKTLEQLVDAEPGFPDAILLLARAQDRAGSRDDAIRLLERATAEDPEFVRGLYLLGELHERGGDWARAAAAYERAVAADPGPEAQLRLANAWLAAGEAARARDRLREVVAANPSSGTALYLLAQAERDTDDLEAAERTARQLVKLEPESARGWHALAQAMERRGRHEELLREFEPAVERFAGRGAAALLYVHIGFAHQELGRHDRAIAAFGRGLEATPHDPRMVGYLVQAHLAARQFTEAADVAAKGLERHADDLALARLQAQALAGLGQRDRSLQVLDEALRAHPDEPAAYAAAASGYVDARRFNDAHAVLGRGLERFRDDPTLLMQQAAAYEREGRFADAEKVFRAIITGDPRHAPALNYLGYMLAERGERLEESVDLIQRALAIDPDNASYLDSLGWAYFRLDRLELAETNLARAAERLSLTSVVQDHLGDLHARKGRYADAIAAWERALAGDGESINPDAIRRKIADARSKVER